MPYRVWIFATVLAIIAVILNFVPRQKQDTPTRTTIPGRNNTALLISNAEHGQINVFLASAQALLLHHPKIEIHLATFGERAKDVASINSYAKLQLSTAQSIRFHKIASAPSIMEGNSGKNFTIEDMIIPPGYRSTAKNCRFIQTFLYPWSGPQHFAIFEELSRLIQEVDPSVVVVDSLFGPALDATIEQNRRQAVLSPNALLDNFVGMQPYASALWKYPATGSSYSYPVPWHLIPANIYINIRLAFTLYVTLARSSIREYLKSHGVSNPVDVLTIYRPDNLIWISQGSLEADFPLPVIPDNVKGVGPITIDSASAAEQDPELADWISHAPTVMIVLGSHVEYDERAAREMVGAIKILLEQTDVQILWKFNKKKDLSGVAVDFPLDFVSEMLGENIKRLRISKWLSIDPSTMMGTGDIAAAVSHGGANSFYEAMINGVPQVILPLWFDLYDFATRAELFGIGIRGSRASAPNWTREELGGAFLKVLGNSSEAVQLRKNAKEFAKKFEGKPGREKAADIIAEMAGLGE